MRSLLTRFQIKSNVATYHDQQTQTKQSYPHSYLDTCKEYEMEQCRMHNKSLVKQNETLMQELKKLTNSHEELKRELSTSQNTVKHLQLFNNRLQQIIDNKCANTMEELMLENEMLKFEQSQKFQQQLTAFPKEYEIKSIYLKAVQHDPNIIQLKNSNIHASGTYLTKKDLLGIIDAHQHFQTKHKEWAAFMYFEGSFFNRRSVFTYKSFGFGEHPVEVASIAHKSSASDHAYGDKFTGNNQLKECIVVESTELWCLDAEIWRIGELKYGDTKNGDLIGLRYKMKNGKIFIHVYFDHVEIWDYGKSEKDILEIEKKKKLKYLQCVRDILLQTCDIGCSDIIIQFINYSCCVMIGDLGEMPTVNVYYNKKTWKFLKNVSNKLRKL